MDKALGSLSHQAPRREWSYEEAKQAIGQLRDAGVGAVRLPKESGGLGYSLPQLFKLAIELAEVDSNLPHILRNHYAFVERALRTPGSPHYRKALDQVANGTLVGQAYSELNVPGAGKGSGKTLFARDGDGYCRITGNKFYSTGNLYCDILHVWGKDEDGKEVTALVPADREGVDLPNDWDGIGQKLTGSGSTFFRDVRVEPDEIFEPSLHEVQHPHFATFPQLFLYAIVTGILRAILRDGGALLKNRGRNFYHAVEASPVQDPLLQQIYGRLVAITDLAEVAVLDAAAALERAFLSTRTGKADEALFQDAALRGAKIKIVFDDLALEAATRLFELSGASGAVASKALDRHWRNIRTITTHNPVSYKARALGAFALGVTSLPDGGFF